MNENKRFNIIDDEWIGLEGSKYVTAIEDNDSPKKTVYFVHNTNVKGVYRLLNQLNDENQELKNNCKNFDWYKQYKILLNENEELQSELKELKEILKQYEQKLHKLKKEKAE